MSQIEVRNLTKEFSFDKKVNSGIFSKTERHKVVAVKDISFDVEKGETIAFIGPNGAGKSTTIKMLTGILFPTSGSSLVDGFSPWEDRIKLAFNIGTVFGQRSQLSFNLPARDSFLLFSKIYEIEESVFKTRLGELVELFNLEEVISQPLRKLSLGQRMRCEIVASLLHNPKIVFLDEPTIGLDVVAKRELRDILRELNRSLGTTIFLTSHDTTDIEALCNRTIIINDGEIMYDGLTNMLSQKHVKQKEVYVRFNEKTKFEGIHGCIVLNKNPYEVTLRIDTQVTTVKNVLEKIIANYNIVDINIEDPSLEEIIASLYNHEF